jgi:menaquinone-dependent protoporphyrinogen IX oxidase
MDLSPFRRTFELSKFIGTAGKRINKFSETAESFVKKYRKKYSDLKFANLYTFVLRPVK